MLIKRTLLNTWRKAGLAAGLTLALALAACGPVPAPATIAVLPTEAAPPATHSPESQGGAGVNANPADLQFDASPTVAGETGASGSAGTAPSETPNPAFTLPQLVPTTEPTVVIVGEIPADLMAKLSDDVQNRAGVAAEAIVLIRAEATTWNDGSLGCPQPGMFYTQALVDGYWVVLQVGDVVYDYRTSGTVYFVLCEQPSLPQRPFSTAPPIVVQP